MNLKLEKKNQYIPILIITYLRVCDYINVLQEDNNLRILLLYIEKAALLVNEKREGEGQHCCGLFMYQDCI